MRDDFFLGFDFSAFFWVRWGVCVNEIDGECEMAYLNFLFFILFLVSRILMSLVGSFRGFPGLFAMFLD